MKAAFRQFVVSRLWHLALKRVRRDAPYVITITGTVGKTSAKECLSCILSETKRPVIKTLGNMATDTGVPLSLLGFSEPPKTLLGWFGAAFLTRVPHTRNRSVDRPYYILEYSSDKPGDISFLSKKIASDVAVVTAITPVHMEAYAKMSDLVEEKMSILEGIKSGGYAALNSSDEVIHKQKIEQVPVVWYGIQTGSARAGVWAKGLEFTEKGLCFSLVVNGKASGESKSASHSIDIQTTLAGKHQLMPVLAACAVAYREGVSLNTIKKGVEKYRVPVGRGTVIAGRRSTTILDDSYNASPDAVKAGLTMLREFAGKNRRAVAIIGNMNELGDHSTAAHKEVGELAAKMCDFFIAVGPNAETMIKAAHKAGMNNFNSFAFATPEQLMGQVDQVIKSRDVLFIKASQNGMRLERVVKMLMAHPEQAKKLLARQGRNWRER